MVKTINKKELEKIGANLGHFRNLLHPTFKPFVKTIENKMVFIDSQKTVEQLGKARKYLNQEKKSLILWVGTKIIVRKFIKVIGKKLGHPYVSEKWLGGMLTNFETLKRNLKRFSDLEKQEQTKAFKEMTKKEKRIIQQKKKRLEKVLAGLRGLKTLPKIMILVDPSYEKLAVEEAQRKGVKIVALCDVSANLSKIDIPIPVNDDSLLSLKKILEILAQVFDKDFVFEEKVKK